MNVLALMLDFQCSKTEVTVLDAKILLDTLTTPILVNANVGTNVAVINIKHGKISQLVLAHAQMYKNVTIKHNTLT